MMNFRWESSPAGFQGYCAWKELIVGVVRNVEFYSEETWVDPEDLLFGFSETAGFLFPYTAIEDGAKQFDGAATSGGC